MSNIARKRSEIKRHTKDSKKNLRVPSLRLHKASGQAYVVLSGKAIYFGSHGTPQAEQEYHQVIRINSTTITDVYAEKDEQQAIEAMVKLG